MQDDPKIAERKRGRQVKKAAEDAAGLTVAERLTRRAMAQTVELTLEDEGGKFIIKMRQPTRAGMEALQKAQIELQIEETQEAANEQICKILDQVCIDGSLDYAYWIHGDYNMIDLSEIIDTLFESIVKRAKAAKAAKSFRNK
jgi:HAMP domain-containing protein